MNIALIGYGKMGRTIEKVAVSRGHHIQSISDPTFNDNQENISINGADVAIEFTKPASAIMNYSACFKAGLPVVSGTTGWLHNWSQLKEMVELHNAGFFYASNFSLGVNILHKVNEVLAKIMNHQPDYKVHIEEIHHTEKEDAPSGTAISLSHCIENMHNSYHSWILDNQGSINEIPIYAKRENKVPGTHTIHWKSDIDEIMIKHEAYSRAGFATGAVLAAEFMIGRRGIFSMDELLDMKQR